MNYSVGRTVLPTDDWQQNVDAGLSQSQRLEYSAPQDTEEQWRSDRDARTS